MEKFKITALLIINFFTAMSTFAYIDSVRILNLKDGRQIILLFDAYKGYSRELNQTHAFVLAGAVQNIALTYPEEKIDFSYEDPGVYDVGENLSSKLKTNSRAIENLQENQMIAFIEKMPGTSFFSPMFFSRRADITTMLSGDLSLSLAMRLSSDNNWPENLIIRSNDPRHEHFLSLINEEEWLLAHGKFYSMRSLLLPSPLLKNKILGFEVKPELSDQAQDVLAKIICDFKETESLFLEGFARSLSVKLGQDFAVDDLALSIDELKNRVKLSFVKDYMMGLRTKLDVYSNAPVLDILLTLYKQDSPDKMVVILGNHLALQLQNNLDEMGELDSFVSLEAEFALGKYFHIRQSENI